MELNSVYFFNLLCGTLKVQNSTRDYLIYSLLYMFTNLVNSYSPIW